MQTHEFISSHNLREIRSDAVLQRHSTGDDVDAEGRQKRAKRASKDPGLALVKRHAKVHVSCLMWS